MKSIIFPDLPTPEAIEREIHVRIDEVGELREMLKLARKRSVRSTRATAELLSPRVPEVDYFGK